MTKQEEDRVLQFVEAVQNIMRYRMHTVDCEYEYTEFCTCGMREAVIQVRKTGNEVLGTYNWV